MSGSRRSKRNGDNEMPSTRDRSDSTPSSSSKRKSSRRSDPDRDGGFNPTSTGFSSTSQSPYPGMAAPSVASSYATANTTNPTNIPYSPPNLIRNESMEQRALPTNDTGRESRKKRDSEGRKDKSSDSGNTKASRQSKRSDKDERRRSSKREEPKRTDSERALDNHRASMVENQFPGEFPSTFAEPYRPPGLAADYYGDHGESVADQPGVRPVRPSIIIAADQAHLHEATIEAAPPPEPSSLGQVGAAASFYGGTSDFESDPLPKPSENGNRPSLKPSRQSTGETSSRSSPGPEGRPVPYSATGTGPAAMAGAGIGAAPVIGEAAEYFSAQFKPDLTEDGSNAAASGYFASQGMQRPTQGMQNSTPGVIRPSIAAQRPSSGSNIPMYGVAAAGIAAAGAGVYYAGHHTTGEHHAMENIAVGSYGPQNAGQPPPTPQNYQSQPPMQQRRRRKGPLSKIVNFFQDPNGVAEYEAYTEAIGVCKYCFDPGSSPRDAPRKHHYNRRYSDGRYGSSTRVDKLNRYQSSEDEKRRRSNGQKWVATGLAGYGLAKMSEAAASRKNNFDDTYSVKSGRPEGSTRVSFAADERVSRSRRTKRSSGDDQSYSRQDSRRDHETKIRKDKRTGELYEERSSRRRRDSSASEGFSKGATISAGVAAGALAAAAGRRNRSNSPKRRYYSKRVSPNHSFVDLSATNSGALGFGSFFSSPSANQRKGKKSKGLGFFNFTNASTSSSDADLAFGAGSVRRKKGKRDDHKSRDDGNVNTEILGLAATGVALAAEADRRDRNGKRRADLMVVKEPRNNHSRRHEKKRLQSPPSESDEENEDWIDASDDESSVDSALAYGGGLSARQSRESLASNDGTDKWSWRWNNGKKPRKKSSQDLSRFEPAVAGLAGAAVGAAAASSGRFGPTESTASLQSLQRLDPIPMSDTSALHIDRKVSAISPRTETPPRIFSANTKSAPLEHPQPFAPISQAIYSSQGPAQAPIYSPSGPPVFSQYPPHPQQAPITESPKQLPMEFEPQQQRSEEKRRRRRNSSPTPSQIRDDEFADKSRRRSSTRDGVKFDLTEEQREKDRRAQARERRRSKREDRNEEKQADAANFQQEANLEREMDEISSRRRSSTDVRTARELEIERELERLYEEDKRQKEARKSKRADTWPAAAAIGAGVAGVAAMAAAESTSVQEESKVDPEERQSRLKSALKQTPTSTAVDDDQSDSQQRRIARMAAARVKSSASPVHDDYASYFIPPELAESVKEHNFAAEHRDNPTEEPAQIVEVVPRTARRKDTFDPFVYRPFGIEPEDDPGLYPWPVPLLDIIEPTPPASARGDMSPSPSPSPSKTSEPVEAPEVAPEEKQKRSSSVTWGEHRTHEYEVITPLEDHEEFGHTATYESSQPAIDLAETTHSDVKPELSEAVTVSVRTNGVPHPSSERDVPSPGPNVEEPQPKANYGQDLEFAAVLAAAAEGAGFDPSIVVNDPTYHRRDSPPGSEGASFYRSPYAETVSDLGTFHDYSLPQQRGFVESEILPTPADEVSKEDHDLGHSKESKSVAEDEQDSVEHKIPGGVNVFDYLDDSTADATNSVNIKTTENPVASSGGKEDEKRSKDKNRSLEMHTPAIESVRSQSIESEPSKKLKRSSTLDEASFEASRDESGPRVSYASDPEGFGDMKRSKKKSTKKSDRATEAVIVGTTATTIPAIDELVDSERRRRLEREDDTYYERVSPISASEPGADTSVDSKKSRRKSKRDSDIWDDTKLVGSSPAELRDDRENGKKSKKRSKRDSDIFDDDTISVSSLPADLNGDKTSRKSRDKKSGGLFGLFSSTKSETSTSPKRSSREMDRQSRNGRDTKSEDIDEPKRKSKRKLKDKDLDDTSSDLHHSRSDSQPSVRNDVRQHSPEDEFVSSEEAVRDDEQTKNGVSFLGERPEMPTVLDGASGSIPKAQLEAEQGGSAQLPPVLHDPAISAVRSRSVSPHTIPATIDEHVTTHDEATSPSAQRDQFRQRHVAEIRTSDIFSSPLATSSPTAVPVFFRRLPVSPGFSRSASVAPTLIDSPISPFVTPRTRQGRPTSTEFRNSKEYLPLYLVERHSSTKQPELEVEETYPSLPSSRTSSAHPSMENLRGDDQGESFAEQYMNPSQMHDIRHSFSHWRDQRPTSPDYLDSGTATPIATEFPKEFPREKPKYEFHSPSELLEDPSRQPAESQEYQTPPLSPMVLPSVGSPASSVAKTDSGARSSRPSSPARDQQSADHEDLETGIGLGLGGSVATALVPSQVAELDKTAVVTTEESLSTKSTPPDVPTLSAPFAMPLDENTIPIDQRPSHEIELSSASQAADNEFALQPVSSKKAKKDKKKKKKRRTLDLADESVEASSSSLDACEESEKAESLAASSATEQLPASEVNIRDSLTKSIATAVSIPRQPELDILDAHDPTSTKGAETESHDVSAASPVNEQAVPESKIGSGILDFAEVQKDNTVPDEVPSGNVARNDELTFSTESSKEEKKTDSEQKEPTLVSQISEPAADKDLATFNIPALPEEKTDAQMPPARESIAAIPTQLVQQDRNFAFDSTLGALDDTDRTEGLNEKSLRDINPLEEPVAATTVENATLSRPSALEEAFANAEAARGTAPEVSEEEALEAFRPHTSLERSLAYGRLDTIVEGSREGSKIDLVQVEEATKNLGEDQDMSSGSKSKQSGELEAFDLDPEAPTRDEVKGATHEEMEITKDYEASLELKESIPISDPSINPFGDDYVLPQEDNIDNKFVGISREQESADTKQPEGASAAATPLGSPVQTGSNLMDLGEPVEEFSWTSTSKKDKKKGKKGRASTLISNASTPMTEMSSTESIDQPEVKMLDAGPVTASTKKSKKSKKKSQNLDWTAEDAAAKHEEVLQQAEEPPEKGAEMEQDLATQQTADDSSAPGGKKAKKNRKKRSQGFNWTDEAATPLTEESIDTTIESQRDAPTAEAKTEDLTWATKEKSKKDKKKAKKSALLDETPLEVDVVQGVEAISMPDIVEEQLPTADIEPRVLLPEMLAEAGLPRDEVSMPGAPDEVSEQRDEGWIPRDVPSMPEDEAATPQDEAILVQRDQHSSAPTEVGPVIAQGPPEQNVTEPAEASQSSAPELREKPAPKLIEASQRSAPEVHEQKVPETVIAEERSELQDSHGLADSREVPQQAQELVEASTLPSLDRDDREASIAEDIREVPEPTKGSHQIPEVGEDHQASILRDSRWASVFGELRQRKALESGELQRQVPEVGDDPQAFTLRDPGWALVLGELKQRKASQPIKEDHQMVPAPDIEQETEVSVPAGAAQNIDILGERTETAVATDSVPRHEEIHPEEQELSTEEISQAQVKASTDAPHAPEQPHLAAIEEGPSHPVTPSFAVAQDMHEETQHATQEAGTEILSRPEPTQQEAILSDNREVSSLCPESDFHQAPQPENAMQLERGDEAEKHTDLPYAPTPLGEEQAEEFSWAPAKRGKKDKKKSKSKPSVFDELGKLSSDSSLSKDIMPASVKAGAAVEAENEIPPIATPAEEPSAEADALSLGPTKKTKKDKKKKKNLAFAEETPTPASDDFDEGRSSIPWPASLAHLANDTTQEEQISEETQVAKEINAEDEIQTQMENMSTLPKEVEHLSLVSATPEQQQVVFPDHKEYTEREIAQTMEGKTLIAEPDTIPKETDEYSWAAMPKKKGKKDKKKRGSVLDISGSVTPQTEDEPPLAEDTPKAEPAEEDDWALPNKKSKKDKKKKKTALSSLDNLAEPKVEEELQPVPDMSKGIETEIDQDIVERTQVAMLAAPIAKEEPKEQEGGSHPPAIVEAAKPEDYLQPTRDMSQSDGPDIERNTLEQTKADILATPVVEQGPGERAVSHSAPELAEAVDVGSATECEPVVTVSQSEAIADQVKERPMATNKSVVAEESILEHKPTAATEDESSRAPLPKESKTDEKDVKIPRSTVVLEESLEDSTSLANTSDLGKTATGHDKDYPVLTESSPTREPDHAAEAEIVTETTTVEPGSNAKQDMSLETEATEEHQQSDLSKPEAAGEEEPLAFTTKKGKKEKKTKRKSIVDSKEHTVETIGETVAAAAATVDYIQRDTENLPAEGPALGELRETENAPVPSSEPQDPQVSTQDVETVAEPAADTWVFSTKKTKKDKKKKRQSTFDEYSSTPSAPATPSEPFQVDKDIFISVNEPAPTLTSKEHDTVKVEEAALTAPTAPIGPAEEDIFATMGKKKSKKDKKKKKALLSWGEENDISTDQPTETSTPANEPEPGPSGGQATVMESMDQPTTVPDVKSVDIGSSQVLEPTALLESSLPGTQQHLNTSEAPVADLNYSDAEDLASGGNTVEAEEGGQLASSTPRKSKKTKKGKKDKAESTFSTAEGGTQEFNSQEEAQSRSLSIPGAFEDVTESASQSLEVPEVSAIKEEQREQPVAEEPKIATEAVSEHAVTEDDPVHPGPPENIGLSIATVESEAAASHVLGDQTLPNDDEPLIQHEAQQFAVPDQANPPHEEHHEQALVHSGHGQERPPILDAPETRPSQPTWSFANLKDDTMQKHANRDSGIQVSDLSLVQASHLQPTLRDSGYVPSPIAAASREISTDEADAYNALARPPRPISPTSSSEDLRQKSQDRSMESHRLEATAEMDDPALLPSEPGGFYHNQSQVLGKGHPSPVDSTTKDRSSALFNSSPSNRTEAYGASPRLDTRHMQAPVTDLHRSSSIHGHRSREDLRSLTPSRSPTRQARQNSDAPIADSMQEVSQPPHRSIFGPFPTGSEHDRGLSPPRTPLQTIHEHVPDTNPSNRRRHPLSDVGSPDRGNKSVHSSSEPVVGELDSRFETGNPSDVFHTQIPPGQPKEVESEQESQDATTGNHNRGLGQVGSVALAGAAAIATEALRPTSRDEKPGDTKSLGKSKSRSTSSKQLRRSQASLENIASSSTHDPVREKGKAAERDMADVYNGYGEFPGAPISPTRPPSVRSRRSMQQLKDLEARLDQLVSENRRLATEKINAEQQLQDLHFAQSRTEHASQEALEMRDAELREKDEAIAKMRETLDLMQKEVAQLTEVNEGLTATHKELRSTHEQRYSQLEEQHAETHEQWQESSRELEDLRSKHAELSTGMEEIVRHELDTRLAEKDAEIQRLRDELEDAKAKIRELQQQILVGQGDEIIIARDEDYFDNACQQLCQHVQQWVLRFSKFSDNRVCRLTNEVRDEKVVDRFDNAILDGSDVDHYLGDRVKRRDVFMSVVMTMIWDYIFTRYLFGMDREQRQKLKLLEKNLSEVGPPSAVHRWRAMTLTLLSKRESFKGQRASDTEAVAEEIYSTLARFLPPPQHLQGQIQESLRNVMKAAVDLSIEMRTQRAEYIMLPPLQPEYDTNGDLARKVYFNAALMNERSGETTSNDELEAQQAVVRMVLFPLVVKKGSDTGEGDEEIVVCPAQVLVARSGKDKKVVKAVSGDRMSIDQRNRSVQSFAPSILDPTNVI